MDSMCESVLNNGKLGSHLLPIIQDTMEKTIHQSLEKIERHLSKQNPNRMEEIIKNFLGEKALDFYNSNQNAMVGPTRYHMPVEELKKKQKIQRYNFKQKRMEQVSVDLEKCAHIEIPNGIAYRCLKVPDVPEFVFNPSVKMDFYDDELSFHGQSFEWLDSNMSNAEKCSRRAMAREMVKKSLDDWVFLYFRIQKRNWEATVVEEKKTSSDVNMYAEDQLHKWTLKLRFKMRRLAPVKVAIFAFLSRMGLESNPNIVFCKDGFYGLMDVGNSFGELSKTPCQMLSFSSTPKYLGMKNGDSIYVNSVSDTQRQLMEDAPRLDRNVKKKSNEEGDEEGGEYEMEEGDTDTDD